MWIGALSWDVPRWPKEKKRKKGSLCLQGAVSCHDLHMQFKCWTVSRSIYAMLTFPPSADDSTREPVSSLGRVPAASVRGNAAVFVRGWDSCARMNRIYPKVEEECNRMWVWGERNINCLWKRFFSFYIRLIVSFLLMNHRSFYHRDKCYLI